jgi:hypothetical protein
MPRRLLTVSELVDVCFPPTEAHRGLWLRRAREWSTAGVLPPSEHHHQGSGRHRLYDFDSVYLAAVLFHVSDLGVPVGVLARISRLIRAPRRTPWEQDFIKFWRAVKTQKNKEHAYLAIAPVPGQDLVYYKYNFGPVFMPEGGAWATINLTVTFAKLKL